MFYRAILLISFCSFIKGYAQESDSLKIDHGRDFVLKRSGSLKNVIGEGLDSIAVLKAYNIDAIDIDPQQKLDSFSAKNSVLPILRSKVDSLSVLSFRDSSSFRSLIRLKSKLDSLFKFPSPDTLTQARERINILARKASGKLDTIGSKINDQLTGFSKDGGDLFGSVTLSPPDLNALNKHLKWNVYPDLAAPNFDVVPIERITHPLLDLNSNDLHELPNLPRNIDQLEAVKEVDAIEKQLEGASEAGSALDGYKGDLRNLQQGDLSKLQELPDAIESRVEDLDEIKSLEEATQEFAAIKAKWNDPQVMKELALNKAKETAVNHFAGHEEELKAAMDKLSKLKAKIPDPEGAIDMFAKRQQFMKGKPIVERLVPGLAFQFQKSESYWLDLNPYMGFKVSGRWLAGVGWNERLAYMFDTRSWDEENRMYGLRTFLHFKLKANFWLKAEAENMNAPLRATPLMGSEIVGRDWIWSYFAGIKKEIQLSKALKASLQTLYNIYNPDRRSPYMTRLNVRMGFQFPMKGKKRGGGN